VIGGLGAAVCEAVCDTCPVPVVRLGVNDEFGRSGTVPALLERYGLTAENLAAKAKLAMVQKKK
jgi:transketolase